MSWLRNGGGALFKEMFQGRKTIKAGDVSIKESDINSCYNDVGKDSVREESENSS